MRKPAIVVVALLAAVGLIALVVGLSIVRGGFTARAKASRLEAGVADMVRDLAIPGSAKALRSPILGTPDVLTRGRRHFAEECAICHGNDGRGNDLGKRVFPPVPDLRDTKDMTEGEIFYVIHNGIRFSAMPAFGTPGDEEEAREHWEVVYFIRHLPDLMPQEIDEMWQYNPKTLEQWQAAQARAAQPAAAKPEAAPEPMGAGHHHH
jgi:mono/diheme cytochrome c family protein